MDPQVKLAERGVNPISPYKKTMRQMAQKNVFEWPLLASFSF
jgi:hypothetical protein